ncbi:hypothetical protein FHU37_000493 [Allostreptomyces psammosilenae]|uniref:Uncharacterized protein n=1 Tax=Allostreptomyces psammosilenae TaxID=1892865 RepID=A0A852ZQJ9_9ACTN|nr:hypothetical protein [Allostreptomyces psammosilenae]
MGALLTFRRRTGSLPGAFTFLVKTAPRSIVAIHAATTDKSEPL